MVSLVNTTLFLSACECLGFVSLTCTVSIDGEYTYDIVLHENEANVGNAYGLDYHAAHEYLALLFNGFGYADFAREVPFAMARLTQAVGA